MLDTFCLFTCVRAVILHLLFVCVISSPFVLYSCPAPLTQPRLYICIQVVWAKRLDWSAWLLTRITHGNTTAGFGPAHTLTAILECLFVYRWIEYAIEKQINTQAAAAQDLKEQQFLKSKSMFLIFLQAPFLPATSKIQSVSLSWFKLSNISLHPARGT